MVLIAALVGATIGAILTYRFSIGQENRTKKREVIEELYGLAFKIKVEVDAYLSGGQFLEFPRTVPDSLLRMRVLTDLYLRPFTSSVKEFSSILSKLADAKKSQYVPDEYGSSTIGNRDEFNQMKEIYSKNSAKFMETLQELAKGSTT